MENILYIEFISEIPLKLLGSDIRPLLCIGHKMLRPHAAGNAPASRILLKRSFSIGEISFAVFM